VSRIASTATSNVAAAHTLAAGEIPGGSKLPAGKADRKVEDDPVLWEEFVGCNWPFWSPSADKARQ
jgi:hypothetical protein